MEEKYYIIIYVKGNLNSAKIVGNIVLGSPQFVFPASKGLMDLDTMVNCLLVLNDWIKKNNYDFMIQVKELTHEQN